MDRKRCVKTLVRAGANVGARNDAGVSVVERAIEHERFELADYLVKWCERHGVELGRRRALTSERPLINKRVRRL